MREQRKSDAQGALLMRVVLIISFAGVFNFSQFAVCRYKKGWCKNASFKTKLIFSKLLIAVGGRGLSYCGG